MKARTSLYILLGGAALICSLSLPARADVVFTDRTSAYNINFNGQFLGATAHYDVTSDFTAIPGDSIPLFVILKKLHTNFAWVGSGGAAVTNVVEHTSEAFATLTSPNSSGDMEYSYDTRATTSSLGFTGFQNAWLAPGIFGHQHTLSFGIQSLTEPQLADGGGSGFVNAGGSFFVTALLPGNWSSQGTGPGQVTLDNINASWTITSDFIYDPGTNSTLFAAQTLDYLGNGIGPPDFSFPGDANPRIQFTLYGAAVPEPGSLTLLGLGLAGIVLLARRIGGKS